MPLTGSWFTFGPLSTWANANLDNMFLQLAAQSAVPCTITGTNTLALTGTITGFPISAYANYMLFAGTAAAPNTGPTTAAYGALPALPVYKDTLTGPVTLAGAEIPASIMVYLTYDSALNSGNGGFHLLTGPQTNKLQTGASIAFGSILAGGSSLALVSLAGVSIGDVVNVGLFTPTSLGVVFQPYITVNNTITLEASNITATSITPPAGYYRFLAQRVRP